LQKKSSIYPVDTDYYFSVKSDSKFGSRSNLSQAQMLDIFSQRGGDPDRVGKQDPLDCLVWMSQRVNEPGWDSNLGKGRPGWHIECTAIALEYLQPSDQEETLIDIQGGGSDLIFPHHEMCATQAQVITGKELASTYVHAGMIGLDGEKMSKSKGNLVFVSRLVASGVDPMAIRWALMSDHYRSDRMWSDAVLHKAQSELDRLKLALSKSDSAPTEDLINSILRALSDDLDTTLVLSQLDVWASSTIEGSQGGNSDDLRNVLDALLGLKL
jgi:L-cysteine:1D-myo-inositol 2-amino-2-deoxy-alpha-D-glucopyranoside ligase